MITRRRTILLVVIAIALLIAGWLYWNRPTRADMAAYVPADSLAFVEANDLTGIGSGIERTDAWEALATPLGAKPTLLPNRWLIRLARWTGFGSVEATLISRSQIAVAFMGGKASEANTTLTIKPLAALIIETHTSQSRMRPVMESLFQEFAQRAYGQATLVRKQVDGVDVAIWSSPDGARTIVAAFVDTVAIAGNDESTVLRCVDVRRGKVSSLSDNKQLADMRRQVGTPEASLFGFVAKAGVKPLLQAWALDRAGSVPEAAAASNIFADTVGNLIQGIAWSSTFTESGAEDRCFLSLTDGVADKLRSSIVPDSGPATQFPFVPPDAHSVSAYHVRDLDGLWRELNTTVSTHADFVGAIAARPLLRSLFKPYGIDDPDIFVRAAGTRLQTIRLEATSSSVLVAEAFDRQSLRRLAARQLGPSTRTEAVGEYELVVSNSNNWAASFPDNYFLIGPADLVRQCLQAKAQSKSLMATDPFRKAQGLVDVSLPITALTFADDRRAAISFVEIFSKQERSAFSTNATAINDASRTLPYSVSVTMLKDNGFQWTSRSAFGLLGSMVVRFSPEKSR